MGNMEEQLDRRLGINAGMKRAIIQDLQCLLHEHHALVRLFKSALEQMPNDDYKVVIKADKRPSGTHERTFNAPTVDEVAILIVGEQLEKRDIVLTSCLFLRLIIKQKMSCITRYLSEEQPMY